MGRESGWWPHMRVWRLNMRGCGFGSAPIGKERGICGCCVFEVGSGTRVQPQSEDLWTKLAALAFELRQFVSSSWHRSAN